MLLVSGCWDMREINELGLVMAVAVDKSTNYPNNYLVTVQLANPKGVVRQDNKALPRQVYG